MRLRMALVQSLANVPLPSSGTSSMPEQLEARLWRLVLTGPKIHGYEFNYSWQRSLLCKAVQTRPG
jgi:hypothetical protein